MTLISQELIVKSVIIGPTKRAKRNRPGQPPRPAERRVVLHELEAWQLFKTAAGLARWLSPRVSGSREREGDLEVGEVDGGTGIWRYEGEGVSDITPGEDRSPCAVSIRSLSFSTRGKWPTTVEFSMDIMSDGTLRFRVREAAGGEDGDLSHEAFQARKHVWVERFDRLRVVLKTDWPEC